MLFHRRKLLAGVAALMAIGVGAASLGWIGSAHERKIAILEIEQLGGRIYVERDSSRGNPPPLPFLERVANYLVGERSIDGPAEVVISVQLQKIVPRVRRIGKVREVVVMKDDIDESDIECLGRLENVQRIYLMSFRDESETARKLRLLLPHCTVQIPPPAVSGSAGGSPGSKRLGFSPLNKAATTTP